MAKLRLGACERPEFLPLVWGFLKGHHAESFALQLYPEDRLAPLLLEHDLDLALISPIEAWRHPEVRIVRDLCVAARATAPSTGLLEKLVPGRRIDASSGCLAAQWAAERIVERLGNAARAPQDDKKVNAPARLVGDFRIAPVVDNLAAAWEKMFGGALILAVWASRGEAVDAGSEYYLKSGLRYAMTAIDSLVNEVAAATGLARERVAQIYREGYSYFTGEAEREGLAAMHELVEADGALLETT